MVIFAGKTHRTSWFNDTELPPDWQIAVSDKGWTNDQLGLQWLEHLFEPYTRDCTKGIYRLLILDGHSSHLTPLFDKYCTDHKIIPLCMPPGSSHILQPLDVGCFSILKRSYGHQVEQIVRNGIDYIDKPDFLTSYHQARLETFTEGNIHGSFRATGLVPYDPLRVLEQLQIRHTPTPPSSSHSSNWTSATPRNTRQLRRQSLLIRMSSPTTNRALTRLVKGCEIAMQSAALLADENNRLRTANYRQRQKRSQPVISISQGGILTVAEGERRTQSAQIADPVLEEQSGAQPRRRALPRCSVCRSLEHTARTCIQRTNNS